LIQQDLQEAVNTAKVAEVGLSMNMKLSEYSKAKNYIEKTKGGNFPMNIQCFHITVQENNE
jgi:hypothetical protein